MNDLSPSPAEYGMIINGQEVNGVGGDRLGIIDPAHPADPPIATVPLGGATDVDRAVEAAQTAFPSWSALQPGTRETLIHRLADALEDEAEEFARLLTMDTGSPLRAQSRADVHESVSLLRYFASTAMTVANTWPSPDKDSDHTRRYPLGVVGAITPWNNPLVLATVKIAMAVTSANTIVVKPSTEAPLAVLRLGRLCAEHLPPGVVNVITGSGQACGEALVTHPSLAKVTFTGSTQVGVRVLNLASGRLLPVSLELGGSNPSIVLPDVDLDWATRQVVVAARLGRAGQSCVAGTRVFVHRSLLDAFCDRLVQVITGLVVGDPTSEHTDVGPLINERQWEAVQAAVCRAVDNGYPGLVRGTRTAAETV